MRFDVSHTIEEVSVAEFERLYFDEPFNVRLCEALGLGRQLIRLEKQTDLIIREVLIEPKRKIPAPISKILRGQSIAYTETTEYVPSRKSGVWHTKSSVMTDKVKSHGALSFRPAGPHVVRQVTGEVTVSVFGVGAIVERFIVADVKDGYEQAAAFTRLYLDQAAAEQ